MGSIPYWDPGDQDPTSGATYQSNPWDTGYLGNLQIPGLVDIDCKPARSVDVKKAHGKNGAKLTPYGYKVAEVTISVLIWTPAQWDEWQKVAAVIWPRGNKAPLTSSMTIQHPEAQLWGINAVYVIAPSTSKKGPVPQSKLWTIKCIESLDVGKKSAVVTVKAADVAVDPAFRQGGQGAKNQAGRPPSQTDTGPNGAPKKPAGGKF